MAPDIALVPVHNQVELLTGMHTCTDGLLL